MEKINQLQSSKVKYSFSKNARLLMDTAQKNNIPVLKLDSKEDLFQLGYGKYSVLFKGLKAEICSVISSNSKSNLAIIDSLLSSLGIATKGETNQINQEEYKLLVINQELKAVVKESTSLDKNLLNYLNKQTKELIVNLTKSCTLDIAEISITSSDIRIPITQTGEVIAINSTPNLINYSSILDLEELSYQIINYYQPARVPIITVLGQENNLAVKIINSVLELAGVNTGVYLSHNIHVRGSSFNIRNKTKNINLNMLFQDKEVEAIINGMSKSNLEEVNLEYKWSNLLILTDDQEKLANYLENHLLISQIIESKKLVLNSKNKAIIDAIDQVKSDKIIYCSLEENNLVIQNQIKANNPVVFIKANNLVLFDGEDQLPIISLNRLPQSLIENPNLLKDVLFAIAASFSLQIPIFVTRTILQNLEPELILKENKLNLTADKDL